MMERKSHLEAGGVLLVDKPQGLTSHDVVAAVRRLVRPHRVGHTGTLDPLATGLLILCIGKATRIAELLEAERKVYRATALLGTQTDTQDVEGAVIEQKPVGDIPAERIQEVVHSFTGWIEQRPPAFSAVKIGGVRSYRLARRREAVPLKPRRVEIRRLEIERMQLPEIEFVVECSKGTFVRTLCSDIGAALGVGACLQSLRRLQIGRFSIAHAAPLSQLNEGRDVEQALLSLPEALAHLPKIVFNEEQAARVTHGSRVSVAGQAGPPDVDAWTCAFDSDARLLAVGRLIAENDDLFFQPKKLLISTE